MNLPSSDKLTLSQTSVSKRWQGIVAFLIVAILFGSEPAVMKKVADSVTPTVQVAIRYSIALIIFLPWIFKIFLNIRPLKIWTSQLTGQSLNLKISTEEISQADWMINRLLLRDGCILGVLTFCVHFCLALGIKSTSANRTSFLFGLCVIFVMLFNLLGRQQFSLRIFLAATLAFGGSSLMFWEQSSEPLSGSLWILGAVLCEAILLIFLEDNAAHHHALTLSIVRQGVAAIPALVVTGTELLRQIPEIQANLLPLFYLGGMTAATIWLVIFALQTLTAVESALIQMLEPVFGTIISFIVLGEVFGWQGFTGSGLILTGTTLAILTQSSLSSNNIN
ncbi:MAG: DMT family transporter [Lyngbya sp.]|nr:DMT family transporter [Lyngbya sp.]